MVGSQSKAHTWKDSKKLLPKQNSKFCLGPLMAALCPVWEKRCGKKKWRKGKLSPQKQKLYKYIYAHAKSLIHLLICYFKIIKYLWNICRELFFFFYFTILYWFCHTSTWILQGCTRVPHPDPSPHLPHHTIPLGHRSAPAPTIPYHALNLDGWFISHMILYMFQCHSPISSHPRPLSQSPKDCSIHLCLFCCLTYRVIITIFLNSIYMH